MYMLFSIINGNTSNRFRNEYFFISLNPILLLRMPNRFVGEATSLRAKEGKNTHRRCFIIKDVFKKFAIFTRKHLYRIPSLLCWMWTSTQVFSCEYCEIFKNTYIEEHLPTTASAKCS